MSHQYEFSFHPTLEARQSDNFLRIPQSSFMDELHLQLMSWLNGLPEQDRLRIITGEDWKILVRLGGITIVPRSSDASKKASTAGKRKGAAQPHHQAPHSQDRAGAPPRSSDDTK
jgi:hypothetical protein